MSDRGAPRSVSRTGRQTTLGNGAARPLPLLSTAGGADAGDPAWNGGLGSYAM